MHIALLVLFFSSLASGLYLTLLAVFRVPSKRLRRVTLRLVRHSQKSSLTQNMLLSLTAWVAGWLPMTEYQRQRTAATLVSAGIPLSPESYMAECLVKAVLIGLLAIPMFFLMPILGFVILLLAGLYFISFRGKANLIVKKKREALELELPRFVSTLAQELKHDTNLQRIFRSYQKHAASILKTELDLTLADMMSGNEEQALSRWESRMNSTMLSEVVRGLQAVKRGDRGEVYFTMLSHDFRQLEIQRLKLEATLRPQKMNIFSTMIMAAFILTYFVVLIVGISDSIQVFF